jgi:hypothetical protein
MSLLGRSAVGIDLSDGTLKAVLLTRRGHRLTLRRAWRIELADREGAELDALAELLGSVNPGPGTRIVLSAPARDLFSRTYLVPAMESARIAELARYEVHSELADRHQDLLVRHHVRKGVSESQVHAYAIDRRQIDGFRARLAERRIAYDDLETPGFAAAAPASWW